jgi:carboxymethylenebutenolidase
MAHEGTFPILYREHGLPAGAGMTDGYIARPDTRGTYPVVVLLAGIDGISPNVRDLARMLARHGYVVVAPNLYRDHHPDPDATLDQRIIAYNEVPDLQAMHDISDAIDWIIGDDAGFAIDGPVAMVGIDTGGRLALVYSAHHQQQVAALVVAYAPLAGDEARELTAEDALTMLPMPVLGLFGAADDLVPAEGVDEAQRRNAHGQWLLYTDAGHDFLDADSPNYDAAAAGDAFQRILKLLRATLPEPVRER